MYSKALDEELFLAARYGDYKAESALYERHRKAAKGYAFFIIGSDIELIQSWDLEETYTTSFLTAYATYGPGMSRFKNYLVQIFRHELFKTLGRIRITPTAAINCISMDTFEKSDDDFEGLHDIMPSESSYDEPRVYLLYMETLNAVNKLPSKFKGRTLSLLNDVYSGYSLREACGRYDVKISTGARILAIFRQFAKDIFDHSEKKDKSLYEGEPLVP